ncbi:hypothetical protein [Leisingera sp. F5]|uniref:hypothetical protein n=1 Tax=Leisingera sp. F5 TaxID=1813816 RepID=UPI0025BEDC59|nr:hypothetical protein [Leisingera sp. F5]
MRKLVQVDKDIALAFICRDRLIEGFGDGILAVSVHRNSLSAFHQAAAIGSRGNPRGQDVS